MAYFDFPSCLPKSEQTHLFLVRVLAGLLIPKFGVTVTKVVEYWPFAAVIVLNTIDTEVPGANILEIAPSLVAAACVADANANVEVWKAVAQYCV
jgi:hypothetical protein